MEIDDFVTNSSEEINDVIPENDEEEAEKQDISDINNLRDALKYSKQLEKLFLSIEDSERLDLTSKLNVHLEKNVYQSKYTKQTFMTDYFI